MKFLNLDRPLVVFDIEATGLNPREDRIVELAGVRMEPNGSRTEKSWLLNPTVPIHPETTAIHGITDDMVQDAPTFKDRAEEIAAFFEGADLAGFGLSYIDVPLMEEEFARVGKDFATSSRRQFDAQRIFHAREPRDLTAALKFYCGEDLVGAHGALSDARASLRVLEGQFERYEDLPTDPNKLNDQLSHRDPHAFDREGRLRWIKGELCVNFGRKRGIPLRKLAKTEPGFLEWIERGQFPRDVQLAAANARKGIFPTPPANTSEAHS